MSGEWQGEFDGVLHKLQEAAPVWAATTITQRVSMLKECMERLAAVAEEVLVMVLPPA